MLSVDTPGGGSLVRGCVIFLFVGGKWGTYSAIPKLVSRLLENYSEISTILRTYYGIRLAWTYINICRNTKFVTEYSLCNGWEHYVPYRCL